MAKATGWKRWIAPVMAAGSSETGRIVSLFVVGIAGTVIVKAWLDAGLYLDTHWRLGATTTFISAGALLGMAAAVFAASSLHLEMFNAGVSELIGPLALAMAPVALALDLTDDVNLAVDFRPEWVAAATIGTLLSVRVHAVWWVEFWRAHRLHGVTAGLEAEWKTGELVLVRVEETDGNDARIVLRRPSGNDEPGVWTDADAQVGASFLVRGATLAMKADNESSANYRESAGSIRLTAYDDRVAWPYLAPRASWRRAATAALLSAVTVAVTLAGAYAIASQALIEP